MRLHVVFFVMAAIIGCKERVGGQQNSSILASESNADVPLISNAEWQKREIYDFKGSQAVIVPAEAVSFRIVRVRMDSLLHLSVRVREQGVDKEVQSYGFGEVEVSLFIKKIYEPVINQAKQRQANVALVTDERVNPMIFIPEWVSDDASSLKLEKKIVALDEFNIVLKAGDRSLLEFKRSEYPLLLALNSGRGVSKENSKENFGKIMNIMQNELSATKADVQKEKLSIIVDKRLFGSEGPWLTAVKWRGY